MIHIQQVVMFTKGQPYGYPVSYQLQCYIDSHPDHVVKCMTLDHNKDDQQILVVVFDVENSAK